MIKIKEFYGAYKSFSGSGSRECEEYIQKHNITRDKIIKIGYSSEDNYSSILLVYEED